VRTHYAATMQPFFSMFPAGRAGAGLVLLRVACAAQLAVAMFPGQSPTWLLVVGAIAAALLILGVLTQSVAIGCLALLAWEMLFLGGTLGVVGGIQGLDVLALALLGPGAYSIDARLFGRRVIHF